jgi:hypothetical protein
MRGLLPEWGSEFTTKPLHYRGIQQISSPRLSIKPVV